MVEATEQDIQKAKEVTDFWFRGCNDDPEFTKNAGKYGKVWFYKSQELDDEIRNKFGDLWKQASDGELDRWTQDKRTVLSWVILLDQFSRNLCRGSSDSFKNDPKVVTVVRDCIEKGWDNDLQKMEKNFFYIPFMHAENLEDQQKGIEVFERAVDTQPEDYKEYTRNQLKYSVDHLKVIERFGRFPHRNEVMGREPTPEETEYLANGGQTFQEISNDVVFCKF